MGIQKRRVVFRSKLLPYILLAPQIIVVLAFFIWPAGQAIYQSVVITDPFGLRSEFVGLVNFYRVLTDTLYHDSVRITIIFTLSVTVIAMSASLLLAMLADHVIRGAKAYKLLLTWPYAMAPPVAAALWVFLSQPGLGLLAIILSDMGMDWNYHLNAIQAMALVIVISAWTQIGYNFIFFLAGLQMIPKTLVEASAIDGAGPVRRFRAIVFPLLSPTIFFLMVMNIVFAFFGIFGIIHVVTAGGPGNATNILVHKMFFDGFHALDLSGSAVQSVILMIIVSVLTAVQFRYIERKVHY